VNSRHLGITEQENVAYGVKVRQNGIFKYHFYIEYDFFLKGFNNLIESTHLSILVDQVMNSHFKS
jgi:hypothetical protein